QTHGSMPRKQQHQNEVYGSETFRSGDFRSCLKKACKRKSAVFGLQEFRLLTTYRSEMLSRNVTCHLLWVFWRTSPVCRRNRYRPFPNENSCPSTVTTSTTS